MLNFQNFSSALPEMNFFPLKESSEQAEDLILPKRKTIKKPFVLVFSTNTDILLLFKTALGIWNYDVAEAASFDQCLGIAEYRCPDLILMDTGIVIAENLSEMQKMREKCEPLKKIPFILLSGHIQDAVRRMALRAGADDFFIKPVNLDLLESALKTRLVDAYQNNNPGGFP